MPSIFQKQEFVNCTEVFWENAHHVSPTSSLLLLVCAVIEESQLTHFLTLLPTRHWQANARNNTAAKHVVNIKKNNTITIAMRNAIGICIDMIPQHHFY